MPLARHVSCFHAFESFTLPIDIFVFIFAFTARRQLRFLLFSCPLFAIATPHYFHTLMRAVVLFCPGAFDGCC